MARQTRSFAAHSRNNLEALSFQRLLSFDPKGAQEEVYDAKSYRAHLRRHWNDRSRKAKSPQRNLEAGGARAHSDPWAGDSTATTRAANGGRAT